MSKSQGNVVDPFDRLSAYSADGLRYYLMKDGVAHSDGSQYFIQFIFVFNLCSLSVLCDQFLFSLFVICWLLCSVNITFSCRSVLTSGYAV